jgi:hypothetical protein
MCLSESGRAEYLVAVDECQDHVSLMDFFRVGF